MSCVCHSIHIFWSRKHRENTPFNRIPAHARQCASAVPQKASATRTQGNRAVAVLRQEAAQPAGTNSISPAGEALPDHIVLAQVQVSRVLGVKKGSNFNEWNNRINRMSYDFVVCAKDSTVLAAIELDDNSHETSRRAATDEKKNRATADAGLRLIR
jgi:hypothetical protein